VAGLDDKKQFQAVSNFNSQRKKMERRKAADDERNAAKRLWL
jgi:hypothetical protein